METPGEEHDHWGEHSKHPVFDWKRAVAEDETRLGYWEWVESNIESDEDLCRVIWEVHVPADSPKEAAQEALAIQRDPDSIALEFQVHTKNGRVVNVDLWEDYE